MLCERTNIFQSKTIDRLRQPEALSKRVAKGGIWVFSIRMTNRCFSLLRTIILARLLAPDDFGLFGISLLSISTLESLSQTGFKTALIRKNENIESYMDTAWTVSAIRGVILFVIIFISSPLISKFFNSSQATTIIRVLAISTLFSGFINTKIILFQKELQFQKQFIYEFSSTLIDLIVSISIAYILKNVWALVWGVFASSLTRLFISYTLLPYCPKIRLQKKIVRNLFKFGKWILSSSILILFVNQGDDIFVGKILGITTLGLYQMAFMISNLPATEITHVVSQVTYPAYSKLQKDRTKLKNSYLNVLQLISFISVFLAAIIFILAPEFTGIFLGEKWLPIIPVIKVLVLAGLIRSIAATTGPIFNAVGKPEINTKWQTIRLIVLIVLIYPFSKYFGILGTSFAVLCSILVSAFGFSSQAIRITKCRTRTFGKMIILPLINGWLMVQLISIVKNYIEPVNIVKFLILLLLSCISYIFVTYLFDRFFNYGIWKLIRKKMFFC